MTHQYSFKIASPCSENFGNMLSVSEGKYCEVCAKTVIDFSQMTDNEIATFIHLNKGKEICGTIQPQQQNKKYLFVQPQKAESPVKRYVMAILASLLTTIPSQLQAQNTVNTQTKEVNLPQNQDITSLKTTSYRSISGKLINKETQKPLSYIKVVLDLDSTSSNLELVELYELSIEIDKAKKDSALSSNLQKEKKNLYNKINALYKIKSVYKKEELSTFTNENGEFTLILPQNIPYITLYLICYYQDNSVKDKNGKINYNLSKFISPIKINYEGKNIYKEESLNVFFKNPYYMNELTGKIEIKEEE